MLYEPGVLTCLECFTKLLDAHVFNGRQEIAKPIVTNFVFQWLFEIAVSFCSFIHTWG